MFRYQLLLRLYLLLDHLCALCWQSLEWLGNFHSLVDTLLCIVSTRWLQWLDKLIVAAEDDVYRVNSYLLSEAWLILLDPMIDLIHLLHGFAWIHLILPCLNSFTIICKPFFIVWSLAKQASSSQLLLRCVIWFIGLFHKMHWVLLYGGLMGHIEKLSLSSTFHHMLLCAAAKWHLLQCLHAFKGSIICPTERLFKFFLNIALVAWVDSPKLQSIHSFFNTVACKLSQVFRTGDYKMTLGIGLWSV